MNIRIFIFWMLLLNFSFLFAGYYYDLMKLSGSDFKHKDLIISEDSVRVLMKKRIAETIETDSLPNYKPDVFEESDIDRQISEIELFIDLSMFKEAREKLKPLMKKYPKDPELMGLLGLSLEREGENKKALQYYKKILEYYPLNPFGHEYLAKYYYQTKEYSRALDHITYLHLYYKKSTYVNHLLRNILTANGLKLADWKFEPLGFLETKNDTLIIYSTTFWYPWFQSEALWKLDPEYKEKSKNRFFSDFDDINKAVTACFNQQETLIILHKDNIRSADSSLKKLHQACWNSDINGFIVYEIIAEQKSFNSLIKIVTISDIIDSIEYIKKYRYEKIKGKP